MKNKKLTAVILLIIAAISGMSLIMLNDIDPGWMHLQMLSIALGTCLLIAIRIIGWPRIVSMAPAAYLTICILCIACFFCPQFEGANRCLIIAGHRLFHPSFAVPLAVVYLMVWHQHRKSRTSVVLITSLTPAFIALFMPYTIIFAMSLFLMCVLAFPVLSARPNANRNRAIAGLVLMLTSLYVAPVLYGHRPFIDVVSSSWVRRDRLMILDELRHCSWFGHASGDNLLSTASPIWNNPHIHSAAVMGMWSTLAILLLFAALGVCFYLAYKRSESGSRRTMILGCSLILLTPPLFAITQLCFAVPGHNCLIPFLSQSGSMASVSFAAVGLILAAMHTGAEMKEQPSDAKRRIVLLILTIAIVGLAAAIGFARHPPRPNLWFHVPKQINETQPRLSLPDNVAMINQPPCNTGKTGVEQANDH